jgi:hypothetical protein
MGGHANTRIPQHIVRERDHVGPYRSDSDMRKATRRDPLGLRAVTKADVGLRSQRRTAAATDVKPARRRSQSSTPILQTTAAR